MKKYISFVLVLIMIFALCACGQNENTSSGKNDTQEANPMKEVTAEELEKAVGITLNIPEDAAGVKYFLINGDLGEVQYVYDNNKYCYRVQKTDGFKDISGMNYDWTWSNDVLEELFCKICLHESGAGMCVWAEGDYSYCISMSENADDVVLSAMWALLHKF